jgi:hypothetical protein
MENFARLITGSGLAGAGPKQAAGIAAASDPWIEGEGGRIYSRSLRRQDGILYFIGFDGNQKHLYMASPSAISTGFKGISASVGGLHLFQAPLSTENARVLHEVFPFTAPVSLRQRTTTIGCGDRLGLATPGHIRALKGYEAAPVLAQQSVRELTLTHRDFPGVDRKSVV